MCLTQNIPDLIWLNFEYRYGFDKFFTSIHVDKTIDLYKSCKFINSKIFNLFLYFTGKFDPGISITHICDDNMTLDTKYLTNLHFNLSIICKLSIFLGFYNFKILILSMHCYNRFKTKYLRRRIYLQKYNLFMFLFLLTTQPMTYQWILFKTGCLFILCKVYSIFPYLVYL